MTKSQEERIKIIIKGLETKIKEFESVYTSKEFEHMKGSALYKFTGKEIADNKYIVNELKSVLDGI